MGCDISPLPLIHHGKQQILIFEKINPNSFKEAAIFQPNPSSTTLENKDKIEDMISQLRQQKYTRGGMKNKNGFPVLESKVAKARQSKLKSIGDLNPW